MSNTLHLLDEEAQSLLRICGGELRFDRIKHRWIYKGNIDLKAKKINKLPDLSNVEVYGNFDCSHNELRSLEGAPFSVRGNFDCSYNQLASLAQAPTYLGHNFNCSHNQLVGLAGAPSYVGQDFNCSDNRLLNLVGSPNYVGRDFNCSNNQIQNLVGVPRIVVGDIDCEPNPLVATDVDPTSHFIGGALLWPSNTAEGIEPKNILTAALDSPRKLKLRSFVSDVMARGHLYSLNKWKDILKFPENESDPFYDWMYLQRDGSGKINYAHRMSDLITELTTHLVYPLYLLDFARVHRLALDEGTLQSLSFSMPPDQMIYMLRPIVWDKIMLSTAEGSRTIDKIIGLTESWRADNVVFPDNLRPLRARGAWHKLSSPSTTRIPLMDGVEIVELNCTEDLEKDGVTMSHCVGNGAGNKCMQGRLHIFSIRKAGLDRPLSTLGIECNENGRFSIYKNDAYDNAPASDEAVRAASWFLEQINSGRIKTNKVRGETDKSKTLNPCNPILKEIGYVLSIENINAVFREYTKNEKRRARLYNSQTGKWDKPTETQLIGGNCDITIAKRKAEASGCVWSTPINQMLDREGNPRFDKKGKPIFQTSVGFDLLDARDWYEASGLGDAIRLHEGLFPTPRIASKHPDQPLNSCFGVSYGGVATGVGHKDDGFPCKTTRLI